MKSAIVERLGQADVLLPALIADGLSANDRVKARLSVLQAAAQHARDPGKTRFNLQDECRTAGIDPLAMEALVNGACMATNEHVSAPGLSRLQAAIWDDVAAMIVPIRAADAADGDVALARLSAIRSAYAPLSDETMGLAQVASLTSLSDGNDRCLHRLVMDLHKSLNRLSADHAEEVVSGAHAYGLLPDDRSALEAFMRGIAATSPLKFDHPGLAAIATRSENRFTIQNDIGETDAHVVVIAVEQDDVTVTYTDVHLVRAKFFMGLLQDFTVDWSGLDRRSAEGLGDDEAFYLVTGRCRTSNAKARDEFLEAVGAALVFLIDWNKARKVLRNWISKRDAVRVLDWAARHRVGHRAFLELGGSELVASAVHHAASARIGFGERLDDALGRDGAVEFLKTVLRVSTEALLEGGSVRLVRDRIETDLARRLKRVDGLLLAITVRQVGLAREIAASIGQCVTEQLSQTSFDRQALAKRARRIEEKADRIAIAARNEIERFEADPVIERLINCAEQAVDELEQAAFIASLAPAELHADVLQPLAELCSAAVASAEAAAAGAAAAADVPEGHRSDSDDALAAVGRLIDAEHDADAAERKLTATLLNGAFDLKTALSALELGRAIERSTDQLAGFGHLLRRHVLADLSN